jgi:outer membrane lipoprotein SlyB
MLIETVPRQGAAGAAAGTMAGAAVGGSTAGATGSSSEPVYKVTLRMDDGSTKVVTQETAPTYRQGDRINLTEGVIRH